MKSGSRNTKRKLSAGTVCMLIITAAVLAGTALVLARLSSGTAVDLSRLKMNVLNLQEDSFRIVSETAEEMQEQEPEPLRTPEVKPTAETTPAHNSGTEFTLTIGGSISLSGEVRKNSRSTDAKVADYTDVMMLLSPQIHSDVNIVFLENILSDRHKASDSTAPGQAAALLTEAGFNMAACGFSQAYANGKAGVEETLASLDKRAISAIGIQYADHEQEPDIRKVNDVQVSFLQYTATVPAKTQKTMVTDGTDGMVPKAELSAICADIDTARAKGAEAVIVLLSWGKTDNNPDKSQRELAQGIANAGADLIVGCGSHVPQAAEYLQGKDGKSVLCVWSLGSLLCGDRSNIRRMSGYLLHVTVSCNEQGNALILNPEYTPVYTWKYKQDGRFYYRCVASDSEAPDGMDNEQIKSKTKAAETVASVLKDSPINKRRQENDP